MATNAILAAVLAYLLGSIPFGLLLTRASGLGDIRAIGSGNIGATNVLRTGRKGLAAATLLLDGLKGVAAVCLARALAPAALAAPPVAGLATPEAPLFAAIGAAAAATGHCAPVWLGFRGGKGVATGLGAFWGLDWRLGAVASVAWLAVAAASRRSSGGALAALAAAAIAAALLSPVPVLVAVALVDLLVVVRHRGNIARLLAGTEPAIGRRS